MIKFILEHEVNGQKFIKNGIISGTALTDLVFQVSKRHKELLRDVEHAQGSKTVCQTKET